MHQLQCGEIWGGFRDEDVDLCSGGITASLYSQSAHGGAGGDIYYLSICGRDLLTRLALADVTGHGTSVADVSEWMYGALEERLNNTDGNEVLAALNSLAVKEGARAIATAAIAAFYKVDTCAYFAYAGHAPALVYHTAEKRWQPVELDPETATNPNAPLGALAGAEYDQARIRLEQGDRLFLYTDGLLDGRNRSGERFGEERLLAILEEGAHAPLHDLKQAVIEGARTHSGGSLGHDDVTLVAIEVR